MLHVRITSLYNLSKSNKAQNQKVETLPNCLRDVHAPPPVDGWNEKKQPIYLMSGDMLANIYYFPDISPVRLC
jgi:hypothetical protein